MDTDKSEILFSESVFIRVYPWFNLHSANALVVSSPNRR